MADRGHGTRLNLALIPCAGLQSGCVCPNSACKISTCDCLSMHWKKPQQGPRNCEARHCQNIPKHELQFNLIFSMVMRSQPRPAPVKWTNPHHIWFHSEWSVKVFVEDKAMHELDGLLCSLLKNKWDWRSLMFPCPNSFCRYCAGTMPWGNPGDHREFEPQRHDDGYIEVIGFTMASLVSVSAGFRQPNHVSNDPHQI